MDVDPSVSRENAIDYVDCEVETPTESMRIASVIVEFPVVHSLGSPSHVNREIAHTSSFCGS